MKPASAKAKGRTLQKWVRDKILSLFPSLEDDDVRSTSMGAQGEDIQLSPAARKLVPLSFECKNVGRAAVYTMYQQAEANSGRHEPVVILKANRKAPLAIVDAVYFLEMIKRLNSKIDG